jgi:hypothetical protein
LVNAIDTVGGIVCDGAKASCAAKISSAVDAGIIGYEMAKHGLCFLTARAWSRRTANRLSAISAVWDASA